MVNDLKLDPERVIWHLKAQRNAYADASALAGAAVDMLQEENTKLKLEIEVLTKALEVLKGESHGA